MRSLSSPVAGGAENTLVALGHDVPPGWLWGDGSVTVAGARIGTVSLPAHLCCICFKAGALRSQLPLRKHRAPDDITKLVISESGRVDCFAPLERRRLCAVVLFQARQPLHNRKRQGQASGARN